MSEAAQGGSHQNGDQETAARHLDTWGHGGIVAPNLFGTLTTETDNIY